MTLSWSNQYVWIVGAALIALSVMVMMALSSPTVSAQGGPLDLFLGLIQVLLSLIGGLLGPIVPSAPMGA